MLKHPLKWKPRFFRPRNAQRVPAEVIGAIRQGDKARESKDWERAVAFYQDAISQDASLSHIQIQLGHALKELDQFERASAAYYAALPDLLNDDDIHLQIGHLEQIRGNFASARYYYQRAVDLNPENRSARGELETLDYRLSETLNQLPQSPQPASPEVTFRENMNCEEVPLLAIRVTGGIGDYIVIARYIRDLQAVTGAFTFDIFCNYQASANWIFATLPGYHSSYAEFLFDRFLNIYALAFRINQFLIVHQEAADWHVVKNNQQLMDVVQSIIRYRPKIELFIEHHPFMDGFLAQKAVYSNRTRANFLHAISGIPYGGDQFAIQNNADALDKFRLRGCKYITVHNGFDPGVAVTSSPMATKCYPHYDEVVREIKTEIPELLVVQVGTFNSQHLSNPDINLINRTTFAEVAAVIAHSQLHLDNEGGLVHLATALGVKCCVVFGPTTPEYFAYEANINVRPTFCGGCWWINETWMDRCPRGFGEARCMSEQQPSTISAAVLSFLKTAPKSLNLGWAGQP